MTCSRTSGWGVITAACRGVVRLAAAGLLFLVTACGQQSTVEIDLLDAEVQASVHRIEAALDLPRMPAVQIAFEGSTGSGAEQMRSGTLRVSAHLEDGTPLLLHDEEIDADVSVERLVSLRPLESERALLTIGVSGFQDIDWQRASVVGQVHHGFLGGSPDPEEFRVAARPGEPDLILYLVDALRPDALGTYGGPISTPNFDAVAESGVRFDQAMTTASWTRPAIASMLSGLYPSAHGVQDRRQLLPEAMFTLAERLKLSGYYTVGLVGNGNVDPAWGFAQGFDRYIRPPNPPARGDVPAHVRAPQLHELAVDAWSAPRNGAPLFLFVHTVDPHAPYDPPVWELSEPRPAIYDRNTSRVMAELNTRSRSPTPELLRKLKTLYLGEVAYADREFGRFLQVLRADPRFQDALLLLTSDHGDAHMEHRFAAHGMSLYEEELRIPLIIRFPRGRGTDPGGSAVESVVSLIDVAPTLLAAAGISTGGLPGIDLGRTPPDDRALMAELDYSGREWSVLRRGPFKLMRHVNSGRTFLFDLGTDPGERDDLSERRADLAAELDEHLEEMLAAAEEQAPLEPRLLPTAVDDELLENLRALGYVH